MSKPRTAQAEQPKPKRKHVKTPIDEAKAAYRELEKLEAAQKKAHARAMACAAKIESITGGLSTETANLLKAMAGETRETMDGDEVAS